MEGWLGKREKDGQMRYFSDQGMKYEPKIVKTCIQKTVHMVAEQEQRIQKGWVELGM